MGKSTILETFTSNPGRNPSHSENRRATKSTSCSQLKTYSPPTTAQLENYEHQLKKQTQRSLIQGMASAENVNPNSQILGGPDPEPVADEIRNAKNGRMKYRNVNPKTAFKGEREKAIKQEGSPFHRTTHHAVPESCSPPAATAAAVPTAAPPKQPNLLDQDPIRQSAGTVQTSITEPELDTMVSNLPPIACDT